jgi:glycosyltransferase involved in cell wall biosynthesis
VIDGLVSIVVPCYNEAETIPEFYRRLLAVADTLRSAQWEFVFVNDGSNDETPRLLNALAETDPRVKVLHLARNRGHQVALTAGLDYALGDIIITIDADLQDPPEIISRLIDKINEGYDVVHAQRTQREGETMFKLVTARLFYRLMRWFSNTPIIENCGDFRAFRRKVLEVVCAFRAYNRFLRGIFVQVGFRQTIIPYSRDARYAGKTKYSLLKMINLSIDAVLSFSAVPIRVISIASILLWCLSLLFLAKSLVEHFILNITVPGWTSIILLMTFFVGLILFSIAIVGAYVGRIFLQSQNPPLYWLADARNLHTNRIEERAAVLSEIGLSKRILEERNQ